MARELLDDQHGEFGSNVDSKPHPLIFYRRAVFGDALVLATDGSLSGMIDTQACRSVTDAFTIGTDVSPRRSSLSFSVTVRTAAS